MIEPAPIACDLTKLRGAQRRQRERLAAALGAAVLDVAEVPTGVQVSVDARRMEERDLREFVELERRCCPFLEFRVEPGDERVLVTITGGEGVKEFLRAEFRFAGR